MAITQDERFLQLSTPLNKDFFLVRRIRCQEGLNELFRIELELLHEEASEGHEPTVVDPKRVLGNPMIASAHQDGQIVRFYNGICAQFTQGSRNAYFSKYRAEIVPKVWALTQNSQSRIFQNKTIPQILEEVLKGFEFDNEIQGDWKPRNYCVQYRESDWDFASRLMEEEGIFYYFEHTENEHRLILGNTPESHRSCPTRSKITYILNRTELTDAWIPSIHTWRVDDKLRTGRVELRDHHFQLPLNEFIAPHSTKLERGGNAELEWYDWPGGYAKRFDGIDAGGAENPSALEDLFPDRERTATIRQQEIDAGCNNIYATSDCCAVTAGYKFELENHPVRANNVNHVVISARHEAVQNPAYISGEVVATPYIVNFVCMPHGGQNPPFRPLRKTPKPIVYGSQTAKVVGNPGDEIFTDKFGRVKVHFRWDRSDNNDQKASAWIRVGTLFAGNKWGSQFIPRVGHEVIVDFLEGDPDQPMIVGSVYNAENMPHYELPKFKTLSYIKSHSTPKAQGFNEIRFEDKAKKEQVFVHSQKRYDLRVRGSMYETCGGSRQEVIGLKDPDNPGGNLTVTVAGCHDFHVKEAEYIGIDQKRNEAVKGEVVEDYQSSQFTLVKTKRSLNAQEIIMEAATKISLKVGASCVVIEPAQITIAAAMVKINSGGFGTETGDPSIDDPMDAELSDNGEPGYLDRPRAGGGRGGRNRRQLRSQHHVYPPRRGESAEFTAMRNRLNTSAEGRHALEVFERNNVQVTNNPGGTAYSGNPTNSVNLDPARAADAAPGFVHEMGHAEADHGGTSADVQNQTRADYIDTQLREDAHAERAAYEAEEEMNAAGGSETYNSSTRTTYQNALAAERARLRAAEPGISDEELNRRSHDAAEAAILQDYRNGNVNTGNTTPPQSYVDYWGSDYDARHGSGTPGPAPDPHVH